MLLQITTFRYLCDRISHLSMNKRLLYILTFLLPLLVGTTEAHQAVMHFYTIADGLQNNQARQIISLPQDRRMMITIEGGFEWFDGQRFHSINVDRQQTVRIENFFSQTHHFDHKDRLWVRDYHRVYLFDAHSLHQLPILQILSQSGLPLKETQNLFLDGDDDLWVSTTGGALWHYDWKNKAQHISCGNKPKSNICDIVQIGREVFILNLDGSIDCYDKTSKRWTWTKCIGNDNAGRRFKALPWDSEHFLLRSDGGLFKFSIKTREAEKVLDDNNIYDFCKDKDGGLWVSGRYLLWHLDQSLQHAEPFSAAVNKANGRKVESDWMGITIDWQGNLWACKQNDGVGYLNSTPNIISHQTVIDSTHNVRSIISHNGCIIAATTQGIFRQNEDATSWRQVSGTPSIPFNHLSSDKDGKLWVSGADGLIICIEDIDSPTPILRHIDYQNTKNKNTTNPTSWEAIPFCLPINNSSKLFTCINHNNISILYPEKEQIEPLRQRFPELHQLRHTVAALQLDECFLIGSQNGFVWYNSTDNTISTKPTEKLNNNPYSDKCNCMLKDNDGNVWIGTQNGLLQVEYINNEWNIVRHVGKEDGLPSNCIITLIEDKQQNLWVATYTGICCLKTDNESAHVSIVLRDEDGINCPDLQERSACLCPDGTILFGSRYGCYKVNVNHAFEKQQIKKPLLLEYTVCDSINDIDLSNLTYLQNSINFIISTLNYATPQHVRYRYRLQGSSHDQWTTTDGKDGCIKIEYSLLPHGNYRLEVQANIMDQEWSESLMIDICITPPWWQTWWAWTLYVIIIILSTFTATIMYIRAKHQRLEQRQLIAQLMAQLSEKESNKPVTVEQPTSRLSPKDRTFIENLNNIIHENIGNEELDTLFLANKLLISRTSLYRKMKSLLGIGANEYIRKVRLHKAKEMLDKGDHQVLNISGIALECGFTSMSHFRNCFKDEFGILPGEIGKK